MTAPTIRCTKFTAIEKGALRAFAEIELDNGMILHDVMLLESHGKRWVNLPAKPQLDANKNPRMGENGKPLYTPIVSIPDKSRRELFNHSALASIDRFRGETAPIEPKVKPPMPGALPFDDSIPW